MGYAVQSYVIDYNEYVLPEYSPPSWWQNRMVCYLNNTAVFICPSGTSEVNMEYVATGNNYLYNILAGDFTYVYDPE